MTISDLRDLTTELCAKGFDRAEVYRIGSVFGRFENTTLNLAKLREIVAILDRP